jgi:GTPase SAR1 family protein
MTSINEIIKREINPFDRFNSITGNFWGKSENIASIVASIHEETIAEITGILRLVSQDHFSRTILMVGDAGSGKSYLLGRLKRQLNSQAFFAYIAPWVDNKHIWRHILRYTVDSLINVPEGQQDSQLILWLKSLSALTNSLKKKLFNDNVLDLLLTDRQKLVKHLTETYESDNIYDPGNFFGVLHDLTDPKLYPLACQWLRGDNLSSEAMQALNVEHCIETEEAAKNILANFGKISTATQPIVLCFDQVESVPNWSYNPQPIFDVNTNIHNDNIQNFLIIITILAEPWQYSWKAIKQGDKGKVDKLIKLKNIDLNQAEAIWQYILQTINKNATPPAESPIIPLNRQILKQCFPSGKTTPRNVLLLGRGQYQRYKNKIIGKNDGVKIDVTAEFKILWYQEYKKNQERISQISQVSSPELIRMLQVALEALGLKLVTPKLIAGKYASYSLSYQHPEVVEKVGLIWTEDANIKGFSDIMSACQKTVQHQLCQKLFLIRMGNSQKEKLTDNKIFSELFTNNKHIHIIPTLQSVHYLATYNYLVNYTISQELVIGYKPINLPQLQTLIRQSHILHNCVLLQELGVVPQGDMKYELARVKDYLLSLVKTQIYLGVTNLISEAAIQFPDVKPTDIQHLMGMLCQENQVTILNPKAKFEDQLISVVS